MGKSGGGARGGVGRREKTASGVVQNYVDSSLPVGRFDTKADKDDAIRNARASVVALIGRGVTQGGYNIKQDGAVIRVTQNVTDRDTDGSFLGRREVQIGTVSVSSINRALGRKLKVNR